MGVPGVALGLAWTQVGGKVRKDFFKQGNREILLRWLSMYLEFCHALVFLYDLLNLILCFPKDETLHISDGDDNVI